MVGNVYNQSRDGTKKHELDARIIVHSEIGGPSLQNGLGKLWFRAKTIELFG